MVEIRFNLGDPASYQTFLQVKSLPQYRFVGRTALVPDEYAARLGVTAAEPASGEYVPILGLFDYQEALARLAIRKRKFAVFAECGLGKSLIMTEFARHAARQIPDGKCVLIVSPLMVIPQTLAEVRKFYGDTLPVDRVKAAELGRWLESGESRIGITNYEALRDDTQQGRLGGLILDESSYLKSHYGKWGQDCLRLGRGLDWKLCLTGTPAPNDRIEYANHAVFLDAFPTVNAFLARYFVNRGQTGERWEIKPHALKAFYRALSHWCVFLTDPATYGFRDNAHNLPPIHIHIHDVELTTEQQCLAYSKTGTLFANHIGGITNRSVLSQIAKGNHKGRKVETRKPEFIRSLVDSWPGESTIVWCLYNSEQSALERVFPDAASITGATPIERRLELIEDFKAGRRKVMISKPKILGLGLNLHIATRQVFSGLQDSYEAYWQAVKRSNRVGSTRPLNVHIPITDIERPMIETVLAKAKRIQEDTEVQEQLFRESGLLDF
jgi:hypothetical protein